MRNVLNGAEFPLTPALRHQHLHRSGLHSALRLAIWTLRGWRGRAPRQPGQVRKEAAITSPAWVVVSLSPLICSANCSDTLSSKGGCL